MDTDFRSQSSGHHRYFTGLVLFVVAALFSACASAPQTGVRPDFEKQRIGTVAIAPFYARGAFGIPQEELARLHEQYQASAAQILTEQGFDVVTADELRVHLEKQRLWEQFEDGIYLRQSLVGYFEPPEDHRSPSIEVETLQAIAEQGGFPAESILFGEVVYHSAGVCRQDASQFTPYAETTVMPSAPATLPRPCVVSHFQAKLVDVRTGRTMWFNRSFLESHSAHLGPDLVQQTILSAVRGTLAEDGGIAPLAPSQTMETQHAESR